MRGSKRFFKSLKWIGPEETGSQDTGKGFSGLLCIFVTVLGHILYNTYTWFTSKVWMHYNEQFRMRATLNPGLHWDQVHLDLWLQVVRPNLVELSHRVHIVQRLSVGMCLCPQVG